MDLSMPRDQFCRSECLACASATADLDIFVVDRLQGGDESRSDCIDVAEQGFEPVADRHLPNL